MLYPPLSQQNLPLAALETLKMPDSSPVVGPSCPLVGEPLPNPADLAASAPGGAWLVGTVRKESPLPATVAVAWPSVPPIVRLAAQDWRARIPDPPSYNSDGDEYQEVLQVKRWFETTSQHLGLGYPYGMFPKRALRPSDTQYVSILRACPFLTQKLVPPLRWILFSFRQWATVRGEKKRRDIPPPAWVFSATRVHRFYGYARKDANGLAGRLIYTPSARRFLALQERMISALVSGVPASDEQAKHIVDATFPDHIRLPLLQAAESEARAFNMSIDARIKSGGWVW